MPLELEVVEGDIAALDVDAVANAANDRLWMGAGVAGALKRAGGEEIEREAVAKGPIALGDAVATGAGRLPARWVIHAAVMGQDLRTSAEAIESATHRALEVADEIGAESLALPAFGTGVGGFPLRRVRAAHGRRGARPRAPHAPPGHPRRLRPRGRSRVQKRSLSFGTTSRQNWSRNRSWSSPGAWKTRWSKPSAT